MRTLKNNNVPKLNAGGVLQSTGSLAAAGFTIGGPWGAAIGGAAGLVGGLFGESANKKAKRLEDAQLANQQLDQDKQQEQLDLSDEQMRLNQFSTMGNKMSGYYRKGGRIYMSGRNKLRFDNSQVGIDIKNAKQKRIGLGTELTATKPGTDTIDANVDGQPYKLDNKEIVIGDTVIPADSGRASQYKEAIKGKSPSQVALISKYFVDLARQEGTDSNSKLTGGSFKLGANGVYTWVPDILPTKLNEIDITTEDPYSKGQLRQLNRFANTSLRLDDRLQRLEDRGRGDSNTANRILKRQAGLDEKIDNVGKNTGSGFDVAGTLGLAANVAGTLGTMFDNASARKRLASTPYPKQITPKYSDMNVNINDPIYEEQRNDINRGAYNVANQLRGNVADSRVYTAQLANLEANRLNATNPTFTGQRVARDTIRNRNIEGRNQYDQMIAGQSNNYNMGRYGDNINRINTDLALGQSTTANLQALGNYIQQGALDNKKLSLMAATAGVSPQLPGESTEAWAKRIQQEMLAILGNNTTTIKG